MQQRAPFAIFSDLVAQGVGLRKLQQVSTTCHYPRTFDPSSTRDPSTRRTQHPPYRCFPMQTVKLTDRSCPTSPVFLCATSQLMRHFMHGHGPRIDRDDQYIRSVQLRYCRRVRPFTKERYSRKLSLPSTHLTSRFFMALDSQVLFTELPTQWHSVDKSIRSDVTVIHHEFDNRNLSKIIWILGKRTSPIRIPRWTQH